MVIAVVCLLALVVLLQAYQVWHLGRPVVSRPVAVPAGENTQPHTSRTITLHLQNPAGETEHEVHTHRLGPFPREYPHAGQVYRFVDQASGVLRYKRES